MVEYSCTGDTAIAAKVYNKITATFSGHAVQPYSMGDTLITNYRNYCLRQQNDVLYLYSDTLLNFSASVGDRWHSGIGNNGVRTYTVTGIGSTPYNGSNFRTIDAAYTYTYSSNSSVNTASASLRFVEKIMATGNRENIFPVPRTWDPSTPYDGPLNYFCGYTDAATTLTMSTAAGCRLISV